MTNQLFTNVLIFDGTGRAPLVQDVSILQHLDNLAMIMKDGAAHKLDLRSQRGQIAAE